MVTPRLILVLGDQLTPEVAALRAADKTRDVVIMAEVAAETSYVPHHPKKIALVLSAMRKFAARLERDGWTVAYSRLDDPENTGSITGELIRRAAAFGATEVIATVPGEWRLIHALEAKRPKARYYVTFPTYAAAFLRRVLPTGALDAVAAKN